MSYMHYTPLYVLNSYPLFKVFKYLLHTWVIAWKSRSWIGNACEKKRHGKKLNISGYTVLSCELLLTTYQTLRQKLR